MISNDIKMVINFLSKALRNLERGVGKGAGRSRGLIFGYELIMHNFAILIIGLVEGRVGVFSKTTNLTYNLHILIIWLAFLSFIILKMIIMVIQV